ncbi:hypothetical protein CNX65_08175 [Actinosynnema pretiosum]|uniref:Peptidase S33 tripeptidyl aminopeptidase-like C-terminal domain-containing protein n=1 Tax=Actinosynnema pretiosum TaxID=42197 RepID=A0A290ZGE6_9PSEU|nr:hypothetical protein CNX65_08175 [Actinosynnema pretiosum]
MVRVLGAVVVSVLLTGAAAQASPSPTTALSWAPCPELPDVECGVLSVPVDRTDPGDGRVGVAVARRVAPDPARRIGVLVVNPGGPGNSGVDLLDAQPGTVAGVGGALAGADVVAEPFPAVFCQDWALPVRDFREHAALTAHVRRVAPNTGGGQRPDQPIGTCLGRTTEVSNPQRPLRVEGAPKILALNGAHDPATPLAGALEVRRQAGDAVVLVTYGGAGHGVYQRSACTRGVADAYLLGGVVPEDGTRCPAVEPGA